MTNRLVDLSESGASLSCENGLVVVRTPDGMRQSLPVTDVAAIVASHRQVVFTQNLVAELGKAGAILVCCDERHHPASMLLPVESHCLQAQRFRAQAEARASVKKRIWQELVRAKIIAQGRVLHRLAGNDAGLAALAGRVQSGDSGNAEAVAAQRYWPRVFADSTFRRSSDNDGRNHMLNYGYAVLRAVTARAVCAAGLHPSFGVGHTNRQNAFCLADDLMEPLRPLVDFRVAEWCRDSAADQWILGRTVKVTLLSVLAGRYTVRGERRTLFDILARCSQAITRIYVGEERTFRFDRIEDED